jgi:hypothetical protein
LGHWQPVLKPKKAEKRKKWKNGPPLKCPNLFFVQQLWVFKISSFKKEKVGWGGGERKFLGLFTGPETCVL